MSKKEKKSYRVVILHPRIGFFLCLTEKSEFYCVFFKFQILLWEVQFCELFYPLKSPVFCIQLKPFFFGLLYRNHLRREKITVGFQFYI